MLFDFQRYIQQLREDDQKKESIERFEKFYGPIIGDVRDQIWYKEYLVNFPAKNFYIPFEFEETFDQDLFLKLVFGSFSSEARFIDGDHPLPELEIKVRVGDQQIIKKITDISLFQLLRLFEIYIEEQINLQILIQEDLNEASAINSQRQMRIDRIITLIGNNNKTKSIRTINFSLFNFQTFIQELREDKEKKTTIEKYEKFYGTITGDVEDQIWYKEYLNKFEYVPYEVPEELEDEFDWEIFLKLLAGTFSSRCKMKLDIDVPTFIIEVKSGKQFIDRNIVELLSFQVVRLFEIYIEEIMNLQILIEEDEKEKAAILHERERRVHEWNKHLISIKTQRDINELLAGL